MNGLEALLYEKADLLRGILAETQKQRGLIESGDTDGLTESVSARRALMDSVDALDARIRTAAGSNASNAPAELTAMIMDLLKEIIELDSQNLGNAEALKLKLALGIKETNAEINLLAYSQSPEAGNLYINRKG